MNWHAPSLPLVDIKALSGRAYESFPLLEALLSIGTLRESTRGSMGYLASDLSRQDGQAYD